MKSAKPKTNVHQRIAKRMAYVSKLRSSNDPRKPEKIRYHMAIIASLRKGEIHRLSKPKKTTTVKKKPTIKKKVVNLVKKAQRKITAARKRMTGK